MMADFAITAHGSALYFLNGELDMATVPLMEIAIEDAVAGGGPITLDLTDVTFADSSGIGAIMKSVKSLPTGCMVLHGVHDEVGRVIDLMGIGRGLPTLHVIPCLHGRGGDGRGSGCGTIVPLGRSERQSG
jgi:anti-anti-sigma factor